MSKKFGLILGSSFSFEFNSMKDRTDMMVAISKSTTLQAVGGFGTAPLDLTPSAHTLSLYTREVEDTNG